MNDESDTKRIVIEVSKVGEWDQGQLKITTDAGTDFGHLMCACEFLIHVTATKSALEYDEACAELVKGSNTYTDHIPCRIIEGKVSA